jgi:hypothetical protein
MECEFLRSQGVDIYLFCQEFIDEEKSQLVGTLFCTVVSFSWEMDLNHFPGVKP